MPTEQYQLSQTFMRNAFPKGKPVTFRGKQKTLGDFLSAEMDYSQLINQIPQTLMQLYQANRQAEVQDQLIALNIQRAQQGKGPISLDMIGGAALAQPGVNVNLSPETKQLLIYGGLGALAIFYMSKKKSRR